MLYQGNPCIFRLIPSYTQGYLDVSWDILFQDSYTGISQYNFFRLFFPGISRDNSQVGISRDIPR